MPLIEYECQSCHKHVEKIQPFSAAPLTVCPHCGGKMEQTISAPAVQFKGAGWYVNDYAKSGAPKKSSDHEISSDSTKPAATTADSKSDSTKSEGASSSTKESAPAAPATGSSSPKSD